MVSFIIRSYAVAAISKFWKIIFKLPIFLRATSFVFVFLIFMFICCKRKFHTSRKAKIEIKTVFIFFLFSPISEFFEYWISTITTVWYTNRYLIFFKIILNLLLPWKVHWGHKTLEIPMQTVQWHYRRTENNFKNLRHCFGTTRLLFVKSQNIWFLCKRNGQSAVTSSFFVSPIPLR